MSSLNSMMGDVAEYERQSAEGNGGVGTGAGIGTILNAVMNGGMPAEVAAQKIVEAIEAAPDKQAALAEVEAMLEQVAAEGGQEVVGEVANAIMALMGGESPEGMEGPGNGMAAGPY